ncbi:DUF6693 family protein [Bartonella sp. DGB2]|uniref:DUF6693 family protein n=1 Tax=Bartonella sp. DGB2 TaxID=3388426 RepID=UPI0039900884
MNIEKTAEGETVPSFTKQGPTKGKVYRFESSLGFGEVLLDTLLITCIVLGGFFLTELFIYIVLIIFFYIYPEQAITLAIIFYILILILLIIVVIIAEFYRTRFTLNKTYIYDGSNKRVGALRCECPFSNIFGFALLWFFLFLFTFFLAGFLYRYYFTQKLMEHTSMVFYDDE